MQNYYAIRQNPGKDTNQEDVKDMIEQKKIILCPYGVSGQCRASVIDEEYNMGGRGQDKRFVEEMKEGDIAIISFPKSSGFGCIICRVGKLHYAYDTGLYISRPLPSKETRYGKTGDLPLRPVCREIEILSNNYTPKTKLPICSLCQIHKEVPHINEKLQKHT